MNMYNGSFKQSFRDSARSTMHDYSPIALGGGTVDKSLSSGRKSKRVSIDASPPKVKNIEESESRNDLQ